MKYAIYHQVNGNDEQIGEPLFDDAGEAAARAKTLAEEGEIGGGMFRVFPDAPEGVTVRCLFEAWLAPGDGLGERLAWHWT
jgi:hypothetical protein